MKQSVNIIGGGAAALSVAAFLDATKFDIHIFEKNKALGRKFLVAGKGGFNLTYDESLDQLLKRYSAQDFLTPALKHFDNQAFKVWLEKIGIPTYTGTSNRIFPEKGIKPIEVLNKILDCLTANEVNINTDSTWTGWDGDNKICINDKVIEKEAINIFCLGGASWKITGADGMWIDLFKEKDINTIPFQASNCECHIAWPKTLKKHHQGQALKNISLQCGKQLSHGEVVITEEGLEGNAIYALSPEIRAQLKEHGTAEIFLDLKPTLSPETVLSKLQSSQEKNTTETLKTALRLSKAQLGLFKSLLNKEQYLDIQELAQKLKKLPLQITTLGPIDKAISTVGGVATEALDQHFQLKDLKDNYCIGEMIDWDAPTGGYLLQACFSMGAYLAHHLNTK